MSIDLCQEMAGLRKAVAESICLVYVNNHYADMPLASATRLV